MLKIRNLNVYFGGIHALHDIRLDVPKGKIVTLVGANGAGKSTMLRAICGLVRPISGSILFLDTEISSLPTHKIIRQGISLVPEGRRVFFDLTIYENLLMGGFNRKSSEIKKDIEWIYSIFPRLKERSTQAAGTLSGGEQQMLALGRALMAGPSLLLLDEPSLGLSPLMIQEVFQVIMRINQDGMTVLLIEQNASAALSISESGYVLETGGIVLHGKGRDLLEDPAVKKSYLGELN